MKRERQKWRNEKGEIMLEALIVYPVVIFLLLFILALFSILFQAWNIQTITNEVAAKAAQIYNQPKADIVTGYVTDDQVVEVEEYRYILDGITLKVASAKKMFPYANTRLINTTFAKKEEEPKITMEVKKDGVARRHMEVSIEGKYSVPFGAALAYFGMDEVMTYKATANAECLDLMDYITTVDFVDNQTSLNWLGSKAIDAINKVLKAFHVIKE